MFPLEKLFVEFILILLQKFLPSSHHTSVTSSSWYPDIKISKILQFLLKTIFLPNLLPGNVTGLTGHAILFLKRHCTGYT